MNRMNQSKSLLHIDLEDIRKIPPEESFVPPWLFKHRDLTNKLESASTVDQKRLVNKLNYIHFIKKYLFLCFIHPKYEERILIKAYPEPCLGDEITCRWMRGDASNLNLENYQFQQLIIADGQSIILVPGIIKKMDSFGLTIQLPDTSYDLCQRKTNRFICRDIEAEIIQNGVMVKGILLDFSPLAFCIRILPEASSPFIWFNVEVPTIVHLRNKKEILFAGLCRCIRQMNDIMGREIVFAPLDNTITRFKKSKVRNPRRQMVPQPTITFTHPFFEREIKREICNVSNSGFSVYENIKEGALMPGMIIPELTIKYAGAFEMKCKAQVIYSRKEGDNRFRCGLSILDMDMKEFTRLTQILDQTTDPYNNISSKVDMDALWEFFFETGFIYPKKYQFINSFRNDFKETYRKLYQENPEIARHFTYEKNGEIYGHIAMVRAYERAWMIHHFAAKPMGNKLPGFMVLKQIIHYLNGVYRLPSAKMDCVITYFQPENRIIDRIFGGFARYLKNPQGSSLDLFSYLVVPKELANRELPGNWSLRECTTMDLWKLGLFYKYQSGGLFMDAFSLGNENSDDSLETIFSRQGFIRKLMAYSLIRNDEPVAFLIVNESNLGFNLSELLNGITIIVTDPEYLAWDILSTAISQLSDTYDADKIPLLIYPTDYAERQNIPVEKQYQLWILNLPHYGPEYLKYMEQKFRMRLR
jgi:hypothetical protein